MQITEPAIEAFLQIMSKNRLDPKKCSLQFLVSETGALMMNFTREPVGKTQIFGDLRVATARNLRHESLLVDFVQVRDRQGFIFTGTDNVN